MVNAHGSTPPMRDAAAHSWALFQPLAHWLALAIVSVVFASCTATPTAPVAAAKSSHTRVQAQHTVAQPDRTWRWPVPSPNLVERPFLAPATTYGSGHRGVDLADPLSQEIVAPAAGIVAFVGTVVDRPVISLEHPGGYRSSFEPVRSNVQVGDPVMPGQPIGVRQGAHAPCGECIHFGVRLHGEYLSPMLLLRELEPSILLPRLGLS